MSQIDDIGAVILALADNEEAKEAFKRALGWRDRLEMDHVTIPRAQYEALMAAAKVFAGYVHYDSWYGSWGDDAHCALAALRAAGIQIEAEG
jgi:hypothetical protein